MPPLNNFRYAVYFDSHRKIFSLKSPKTGRVEYKSHYLQLCNCELKVSQKGRARAIRDGKKNVHAFVVGDLVEYGWGLPMSLEIMEFPITFGYSPFGCNNFTAYTHDKKFYEVFNFDKVLMWIDKDGKPHCHGGVNVNEFTKI